MAVGSGGTLLAAYGTLRRGERNAHLVAAAEWLGTGTVPGRLHVVRESVLRAYAYPLLLDAPGTVAVEVYRIGDPGTLVALDALERYDPSDEERSEYVRRTVPVRGLDGIRAAEVYVYAGDPAQVGEPVPDGDWVRWAARVRAAGAAGGTRLS